MTNTHFKMYPCNTSRDRPQAPDSRQGAVLQIWGAEGASFFFSFFGCNGAESTCRIDHYVAYCTSPR
jgi:hypothetical protein